MPKEGNPKIINGRQIPLGHFIRVAYLVYKSNHKPDFHKIQLKEAITRMEISNLERDM